MKIAYFHCPAGISGDMCLGALVDAGADLNELQHRLALLPLTGYNISSSPVVKGGISARKVSVEYAEHQPHRRLHDIIEIINQSGLSPEIQEKSCAVFCRLAEAEAKVHGTTREDVHFHEVGAVDAIIDIVGTVICLSLLGIDQVISSPLPMGHGFIKCAHGLLPLPAPATQELLKGAPVYGVDVEGELVTPTGASLITTLAQSFGPYPEMRLDAVGRGAGTKNFAFPNLLTVSIGSRDAHPDTGREQIMVLETAIDDMNPEIFSHLWEVVFSLGALDMYLTAVQMKKGRPGSLLTLLCRSEAVDPLIQTVLKETSSLGIRIRREDRFCCPRQKVTVRTRFGEVSIKIGTVEGTMNISPEYEDCRKLAQFHQVPLKEIYLEAITSAKNTLQK
ncbi:nickel pincer cofactor biosynthesis protein LarC [Candidatus Formimonas warabiya]|uniref:Pyridinium-3,5-bisthiocarboxylic acid mononucleotide nickel insertion protein n=1 Tax=Formimonas warabiya TaxID=1761012 RepID=A0A3G1KVB7_FORW1|nr:nickel pincer cofactor biosynthesis protein LarC [Candidatus Formimonas warabiya]ATW26394.1 TIGR00299 family protein [Candidatus Formimonas warabiya]